MDVEGRNVSNAHCADGWKVLSRSTLDQILYHMPNNKCIMFSASCATIDEQASVIEVAQFTS